MNRSPNIISIIIITIIISATIIVSTSIKKL